MEVPNIKIVREYKKGVTFYEALKLVEGKRMPSNLEIDAILQNEEAYNKYKTLFYCWTGTLLIYEEAGKPFREFINDEDLIVDIPKQYRGMVNKALLIEHPNYRIEKGQYNITFLRIIEPKAIKLIDFPENGDWYLQDEYGIPNKEKSSSSNNEARRLWRRPEASVRPLARDGYGFGDNRRVVDAGRWRDGHLGVGFVEEKTLEKVQSKSKKII